MIVHNNDYVFERVLNNIRYFYGNVFFRQSTVYICLIRCQNKIDVDWCKNLVDISSIEISQQSLLKVEFIFSLTDMGPFLLGYVDL